VQGVGFRFTAERIATKHNIVGWVKNLPDARVELLVQGSEASLNRFVSDLHERLEGYILDFDKEELATRDDLKDFQIRFF